MSTTLNAKAERGGTADTGRDRRRGVRTPHVAEAWLASPTSPAPEDRLDAMTLNLSRHGVAFELACPLSEGTFWIMELGLGEQRISSEIRIASCRKGENGLYEIGAEFC